MESRLPALLSRAIIIGGTATAVMDIAAEAIRRTTGVPPLNLDFVGRWVIGMKDGVFTHESIAQAPSPPGERTVGLAAHYLIGIGFAGLFELLFPAWSRHPKLATSVLLGISTTAAPWLLMQPAFGLGIAASKTPNPGVAMFRSLRAHTIYGVGLHIGAKMLGAAAQAGHKRMEFQRERAERS